MLVVVGIFQIFRLLRESCLRSWLVVYASTELLLPETSRIVATSEYEILVFFIMFGCNSSTKLFVGR